MNDPGDHRGRQPQRHTFIRLAGGRCTGWRPDNRQERRLAHGAGAEQEATPDVQPRRLYQCPVRWQAP